MNEHSTLAAMVTALILLLVLAPAAQAGRDSITFSSADGSTASVPVPPQQLEGVELHTDAAGRTQITVYTRQGRTHQATLPGPLARIDLGAPQAPPLPVYEPPSGSVEIQPAPYGCGAASFADAVVSQKPGMPGPAPRFANPQAALGAPDGQIVALGCGGRLALGWRNVHLMDVPGADLRLFTAQSAPGDAMESVQVFLRLDSGQWTDCGELDEGGELDIAGCGPAGMRYNQVLLQDAGGFCRGPAPGADVDAIELLGCVGE